MKLSSTSTHRATALLVAALALPCAPAAAAGTAAARWVATWGAAPSAPAPGAAHTFTDQTLRLIVRTSIGGSVVRIRLSNEFGTKPLRIGAAQIGLRQADASIVAGSGRPLTFGGNASVTIEPGAPVLSDPVQLNVAPLSDLAVSLHLPGTVAASTVHHAAFQTSYVSQPGDFSGAHALPVQRTINSWPLLTEVDVGSPHGAAIVALGDAVTDGAASMPAANHRWPDLLAVRLLSHPEQLAPLAGAQGPHRPTLLAGNGRLGVVQRGIAGNRLLRAVGELPMAGPAAVARFDRDVLATAGVKYLIVQIGNDDIGQPGATASELIGGYRQLIERARARGIAVFGATLTPFDATADKDALRQAVNAWIRSGDAFDGVIDFDQVLRDPNQPSRLLPAYDSGDHRHPNDLGMQAMAGAIPLALFGAR